MLYRYLIIIPIWFFSFQMGIAQTIDQIKADTENYLFGEGWGESLKLADNAALAELTSKISVSVRNDFSSIESEKTEGNNFISETHYNSIINTYSHSTLTNTERIVLKNEPNAHVFRYIKKSEIERIFEGRKNKIFELISIAETADIEEQVSDALRYYYWAYVLLGSMRYPNEIRYEDQNGDNQLLTTWLPKQINNILSDISVEYWKQDPYEKNVVELKFYYKEKPVRNLDYTYFDGIDWSNIYSAKDGLGIIELRPQSPKNIQIKIEYECYSEALIDSEVSEVLNTIKSKVFKKAYTSIKLDDNNIIDKNNNNSIAANYNEKSTDSSLLKNNEREITEIEPIIEKITNCIIKKQHQNINTLFTEDGYHIYESLIKYGNARLIDKSHLSYLTMGDEIYCRNLMMSFAFANNNRKFVENVTLTFNKQHKISNITFGLDQQSISDILSKKAWNDNSKLNIINFLENYKTAYALKRIDYISNIFSDDALIITGRVVKKTLPGKEGNFGNNKFVEYTRQNKHDYIKRLRQNFLRNEFINIKFANTDLSKMGKGGEVYGIQIRQDYYSTYYGDTGYLFLMVDLNNPIEPTIHIRTWQPERDPNFGVIGAGNF